MSEPCRKRQGERNEICDDDERTDKLVTEQKVKKRGWVKNAAIIFLSVLLALTFFSSTIMNRSLPEVAAQYVRSGTLSVQIRGSGNVTAAESFEVKSETSRKVLSVPVKVGDEVKVGDTLILFSDAESDELKDAQDALDTLELSYQKALINAASGQYSDQKRAVQDAQDALNEAKAQRDASVVTNEELAAAENTLYNAKVQVASCEAALANAEASLEALGGPQEGSTGNYAPVTAAAQERATALNTLEALKLLHNSRLSAFETAAIDGRNVHNAANPNNTVTLEVYKEKLAMEYSALKPSQAQDDVEKYEQSQAYYAVKAAQEDYNAADKAYYSALSAYYEQTSSGNMVEYNKRKAAVATAEANLKIANNAKTAAEEALDDIKDKRETYDDAVKEVNDCQKALTLAMQDLEKAIALENLDFNETRADIEEKRAELEGLKSGGEGSTVTSLVNGIVSAVNVSAGNSSTPDSTLMVIEVPDMGYTVSFPVTNEQSQRVRVGDAATVMYNYWGSNINANLAAIKTNPENPTTSKLLVFKVSGDVQSGSTLTISIGEKGSNYDAIIPNSAVRSDSNGDFVLVVEAKSSALGNRYKAVRIDVQVLAKDDAESAVSGGLATSDFVITNSSAPIEPGMLVRLPD